MIALNSLINADTTFKIQKRILRNEIDDAEFLGFAIENLSEMMGFIALGNQNIKIHRDITGEMWLGLNKK